MTPTNTTAILWIEISSSMFFVNRLLSRLKRYIAHSPLFWLCKSTNTTLSRSEQAESLTQDAIDTICRKNPTFRSLHHVFLVFNENTDNEFSVEIDHLLITEKNIFVIETKSQNGAIYANRKSNQWHIADFKGSRSMRNATLQVNNHAKVLRKQFQFGHSIIPIVNFVGHVQLVQHDFHHVTTLENLLPLIEQHEKFRSPTLYPTEIVSQIEVMMSKNDTLWKRHIVRADQASRV